MKFSRAERSGDDRLSQYRAYFFDGLEQRISHVHEFEATDDKTAIDIAAAWQEGRSMELWDRDRLVKKWDQRAS